MRWEVRIMRSKSSFFDAFTYRNVLARHWFITPAYAVVMTFQMMQYLSRSNWQYHPDSGLLFLLRSALSECPVICAGACIITAMLLYRWLFNTRYTAFITSLPIRREVVFFSQAAAGLTLLTAGNLLAILAAAAVGAGTVTLRGIIYWMVILTLLTVSFFGFSSFCSLLTGSILILPVLYTILLYAAVALEASVRLVSQFLVFGLTGQHRLFTALSPVYHLGLNSSLLVESLWQPDEAGYGREVLSAFHAWPLLFAYAAAGILFFAAAGALLRRRRMENSGAAVAVPWLRDAFCWGAALAGSFTLGYFTLRLVFGYSGYNSVGGDLPRALLLLLVMMVGAFIGWFGARGLLRKSVRVFNGGWKGFAVFAALLAAFVLGMETDVSGLERAVPGTEDVGSVRLYAPYSNVYETQLREPENIAAAIELHRSIIGHKALFERMPVYGYSWNSGTLEIVYCDHEGKVLFSRAYAAANGPMAWSSAGNAYATDGSAWGSGNPDLGALEDLMNCREAVAQRLTPDQFPPSAYTAANGYAYLTEDGYSVFHTELDGAQVWELYQNCVIPDSFDSTLGQVRLVPAEAPDGPIRQVNIGLTFTKRGEEPGDILYEGIYLIVPEDAKRTNAWLAAQGMPLAGGVPDTEEPPAASTYDLPKLDGLAGLLERIYLEYDPTAAGTVVSARWTRSLLDWYAAAGADPSAVREAAGLFARRYVITESFLGSLQKLRSAGLQLVDGRSGLVRDYRFARLGAEEVNTLFNAVKEGFDEA